MNRKLFKRFASAVLAAGLLGGVLIVPSVSAAAPNWTMSVGQDVDGAVTSGGVQGFDITIKNVGPSNISSLYLVDNVADSPVYISDPRCNAAGSGRLYCNFGAVNAGVTIGPLTVAFTVPFVSPAGNSISFALNTTGNVPGKNNSHGDALIVAQSVTVVGASSDQGGTFQIPDAQSIVQTNQSITKNNPQSTKVETPAAGFAFPISVADGSGVTFPCVNCSGLKQFGQWSAVNVNGGNAIGTAFKVTLVVYSKSVPSNLSTFGVIHTLNDGSTEFITATCGTTPPVSPAPQCINVTTDSSKNLVVEVWLYHNGGLKNFGS